MAFSVHGIYLVLNTIQSAFSTCCNLEAKLEGQDQELEMKKKLKYCYQIRTQLSFNTFIQQSFFVRQMCATLCYPVNVNVAAYIYNLF